ncbi:MAG: RDD family protein [Myxococcales bacterium]|nr:RDD family protein [Myxococcales bacterium]
MKGAPVMLAVDAAPFWRRLLAGLIDLGLLAALGYALWTVGVIAPHHLPPQRFDWIDYTADLLANHRVQFRPAAVVLLTAAAVHGLVGRTFAGRTVGEALLGLRLVTWYGEDAGPVRSLAHTAGTVVGLALLLLGYVWAAVDPRRQGLAEYVSGTLLVQGKPRADR